MPECSIAPCTQPAVLMLKLQDNRDTVVKYRCQDHAKRDPLRPVVDRRELSPDQDQLAETE